jgi:hypothetical protein
VEKLVFQSLRLSETSKQSELEWSVESDRTVIKHKLRLDTGVAMEEFLP